MNFVSHSSGCLPRHPSLHAVLASAYLATIPAEVGLVWWSDATNEKGDGWMTWSEASRVHELRGKTDKEDYEQLLGELNGQPEATTAQWFAGRHERWDEAGLEWNRSDQRITI